MQIDRVSVDGKFTFPMASAKELPPHFATIYKAKIPCNEKHGPCTVKLANTPIWKDVFIGPYTMVYEPPPMQQQIMLDI